MIVLPTTSTSLRVTTSSAESLDYYVAYLDHASTAGDLTGAILANSDGNIASATTTTIVAAPGANVHRQIRMLTLVNRGVAANNVRLEVLNGADTRHLTTAITLDAGESLEVDAQGRIHFYDTAGLVKQSGGGGGGGDALTTDPLSQFAATTSAQLAGVISDETGSGALVFANSPTLVTPALGTPASGVLTNCTGLPTAGLVDDAVTYAKVQDVSATDRILGRATAGAGVIEEITCTAAGRAILDDANAAAQRTTLGLETVSQAEAEAGTATTERAWTAERVAQAIAALASGSNPWTEVVKTSDEARNTTTTLTDDGALVAALSASTTYAFEVVGHYKIANATMDFKATMAYSGTTTGDVSLWAGRTAVDGASLLAVNHNAFGATVAHASGAAGIGYFTFRGVFTTNASGNLSLQWAQNSSDAGDLTMLKGAILRYRQVSI